MVYSYVINELHTMKRHSLLFALFIFLSSLSIQAEGTAGKWSERYNVTAITMDEGLPHNFVDDILKDSQGFYGLPPVGKESPVMTVMNLPPSIWEAPTPNYEATS